MPNSAHEMAVFGQGMDPLRSYTYTDPKLLVPMPRGWTFEEASTMPTTWMTVWAGLEELVGVRPGCRMLVHAATGGVGLLAVQLAQAAGARVYATAGAAIKQAWPRHATRQAVRDRTPEQGCSPRRADPGS